MGDVSKRDRVLSEEHTLGAMMGRSESMDRRGIFMVVVVFVLLMNRSE